MIETLKFYTSFTSMFFLFFGFSQSCELHLKRYTTSASLVESTFTLVLYQPKKYPRLINKPRAPEIYVQNSETPPNHPLDHHTRTRKSIYITNSTEKSRRKLYQAAHKYRALPACSPLVAAWTWGSHMSLTEVAVINKVLPSALGLPDWTPRQRPRAIQDPQLVV